MKSLRLATVALVAFLLPPAAASVYSVPVVHAHYVAQETEPEKPAFHYVCPMHEDVTSKKPGKCRKCKMKLEKKRIKEPVAKPSDQ